MEFWNKNPDWFQKTLYTRVRVNVKKHIEKAPILWYKLLHKYLIKIDKNKPTTPSAYPIAQWYDNNPNVDGEIYTALLSVFFGLVPTPPKYLSIVRDLIFCFILVHTQVILARNYYIFMYTTKKHNLTWTYIFKKFNRPFIIYLSLSSQ